MRWLFLALLLLATPALADEPAPQPALTPSSSCTVVKVPTGDGLNLVADHCPAKTAGAPVVILLHMIPPHHDRTNYPPEFRAKLLSAGIEVLNLDRRGGGDSDGVAKEAYIGPNGPKDVQGAIDWLRANSKADLSRWACVGASNGTTTCLDYAIKAADGEGLVGPSALVFMTGGNYTEAQNALKDSVVTQLPVLFTYNAKEAAWSEAQKAHAPDSELWEFKAYEPGGHGTRVFAPNPTSMDDVTEFLGQHLKQ